MEEKTRRGAPRSRSARDIDILADSYENDCRGHPLEHNGEPVLGKDGQPVIVGSRPLTLTGLALALGFRSRTDMLSFAGKRELREALERARSRVERYAEERLFDKDMLKGAQYELKYSFGWETGGEDAADGAGGRPCIILQQLLDEGEDASCR